MTGPAIRPAPPDNDTAPPPGGGTAGLVSGSGGGVAAESIIYPLKRTRVIALSVDDPTLAAEQLACALRGRARAIDYLRQMIGGLA